MFVGVVRYDFFIGLARFFLDLSVEVNRAVCLFALV